MLRVLFDFVADTLSNPLGAGISEREFANDESANSVHETSTKRLTSSVHETSYLLRLQTIAAGPKMPLSVRLVQVSLPCSESPEM
jgi:hypothetical protein